MPYSEHKLTRKQEAFVNFYVTGETAGNCYQSALRAGYADATARVDATKFLDIPKVADAVIAKKLELQASQTLPTSDDIIRGLATEATGRGPDTTSASRVAAWRSLADISGLLGGTGRELPQGVEQLLDAFGRGLAHRQPDVLPESTVEVTAYEVDPGTS